MSLQFSDSFEQLVRDTLATGQFGSAEELLVAALESLRESEEDLQAIQAGLDSIDRGEPGIPLDEAFRRLRQKYGVQDEP